MFRIELAKWIRIPRIARPGDVKALERIYCLLQAICGLPFLFHGKFKFWIIYGSINCLREGKLATINHGRLQSPILSMRISLQGPLVASNGFGPLWTP